jgi:acyl-coenzyme A thioesterase 13
LQLEIISAKPGYVEAKMRIQKEHTNRLSSLHGGVICSLVDTIGSLAVCTQGFWQSGVSTDIHTTSVPVLAAPTSNKD